MSLPGHDDNDSAVDSATFLATAIRELASLNVTLYEHAAKIPSLPMADANSPEKASGGARSSQRTTLFAIDETFHPIEKLIDGVNLFSHAATNTPARSSTSTKPLDTDQGMMICHLPLAPNRLDGFTYNLQSTRRGDETGICSQDPARRSDQEQNLPVQSEKEDEDVAPQEST
ncbi:hypothetical protein EPUS_07552 [Endocarpon pusillum Z07020]|uniref:Uncharacterized protein n=1 Tax=Endocarpon pusillum (strain Z07020 / HMAS-L-300199) TaxID=1263415 RepID=U1HPR1_ENDPU|nr:uncharacterized protein EPUS_07552 [Endocarpon pusillum Z07020]ERF72390.1 hypothetical protein EPUS_07552 [Endocarpon pusillum Z07020]